MKKDILLLKEKYGTNKAVANVLGVTERYILGLLAEEYEPGKPLQKLIKIFVNKIEEER